MGNHQGGGPRQDGRQDQVLRLAVEGLTDKAIASQLGISPSTVNSHFRRLFARYNTNNRTRLVALAVEEMVSRSGASDDLRRTKATASLLSRQLEGVANALDATSHGVLIEDAERKVVFVNRGYLNLLEIPCSDPSSLLGEDSVELSARYRHLFADSQEFMRVTASTFANQTRIAGQLLILTSGKILTREFVPTFDGTEFMGGSWIYEPTTEFQTLPHDYPVARRYHLFDKPFRDRVVVSVLETTARTVGASGISFWKTSSDNNLSPESIWRLPSNKLRDPVLQIPPSEGEWWQRTISGGRPYMCSDAMELEQNSIPRRILDTIGARSLLVTPVFDGPHLIGAVAMANEQPRNWDTFARLAAKESAIFLGFILEIQRAKQGGNAGY